MEKEGEIKVYGMRWVQLVVFMLISMSNGMLWITYAPITNFVVDYYSLPSAFWVNMMSLIYMILYIPMVFPSGWVLDGGVKGGLRTGLWIGGGGTALSALIRAIPTSYFIIPFIGQVIGALVQPFILNAPPVLAANWFPAHQRTIATTLCSLANPIGVAIGFVLPPLIVSSSTNSDIILLMLVEGTFSIIVSIITFIVIREKPPTAPSLSSEASNLREENFVQSLKILFTDKNFLILLIVFGCGLGAFNSLATLLNQILLPYSYTDNEVGAFGAAVVIMGIIGSGLAGGFVDWKHKYKLTILLTFFFSVISLAILIAFLAPDNFWILLIAVSLFGFTLTPIIPLSLELCCEITYPLKEGTPSGLLMTSGQIVGIFLIVIMDVLIKSDNIRIACSIVLIFEVASFILMLFLKENLKRLSFANSEKESLSTNYE